MQFYDSHILTVILLTPLAGALLLLFIPRESENAHRVLGNAFGLLGFLLSLPLLWRFDTAVAGYQFGESMDWIPSIGARYTLGIDGISYLLVMLTTALGAISILSSWSAIQVRKKEFYILFLLLQVGMLGVFMALDFFLFYLFWEVMLVPMYFLIGVWGSERRLYAAIKFFLYTLAGSVLMLLAILALYYRAHEVTGQPYTFDIPALLATVPQFSTLLQQYLFWGFFFAFAIKVPMFPFHTWLPDAHTEAPTAGSMILAGVLLKLGAYGFLRLVLPLYPAEAKFYAGALAFLALMAIVAGALASFGQTDFKRLVAYSSVGHMGFVVLGIAVAAVARDSEIFKGHAIMAANGAVLQMFNHGLSSAGMFLLVGVIYDRTHTRNLNDFGGLFPLAPVYGGILIFTSMASLGLPGLNGFVSEFMVVRGAWPVYTVITAIGMLGLLMTGAYILKGIQKVLHGPVNQRWAGHRLEISRREVIAIAPLLALMLVIGVWPAWLVSVINAAITRMMG